MDGGSLGSGGPSLLRRNRAKGKAVSPERSSGVSVQEEGGASNRTCDGGVLAHSPPLLFSSKTWHLLPPPFHLPKIGRTSGPSWHGTMHFAGSGSVGVSSHLLAMTFSAILQPLAPFPCSKKIGKAPRIHHLAPSHGAFPWCLTHGA